MKKKIGIKIDGKIETIAYELERNGEVQVIPFPKHNKTGFHFSRHQSGTTTIRTPNRAVDLVNPKVTDLFDMEQLKKELLKLIGPIPGEMLWAEVIFIYKKTAPSTQNIIDFDAIIKTYSYGLGGLVFDHLRNNRKERLMRYKRQGHTIFVYTDRGERWGLYSLHPPIGIRLEDGVTEKILEKQPIVRIMSQALTP